MHEQKNFGTEKKDKGAKKKKIFPQPKYKKKILRIKKVTDTKRI